MGGGACGGAGGFAAVGAEAADFCAHDGDFDAAVSSDWLFELFVKFAFEFADFAAAHAGYVNVVARAVAFVEVAVAAEVEKIEFVDQALALQQVEGAINGDLGDSRIYFYGAFEDFAGVQVAAGGFHHLEEDAALASEANAAGAQGLLQMAGGFAVDAFAGGDAVRGVFGHAKDIIAKRERERLKHREKRSVPAQPELATPRTVGAAI